MIIVCAKCNHEVSEFYLFGYLVAKGVQYVGPHVISYHLQQRRGVVNDITSKATE